MKDKPKETPNNSIDIELLTDGVVCVTAKIATAHDCYDEWTIFAPSQTEAREFMLGIIRIYRHKR